MASIGTRERAVILVLALTCSACSPPAPAEKPAGSAPATATAVPRGNVTVRLGGDWSSPGPGLFLNDSGSMIAGAMYDRLVALNADGKVVPYLAESWTTTPTSITFKIKKGPTCADGTAITATTVASSFQRLVSPELKSAWEQSAFGPGPYTITSDAAANTVTFAVATPNGQMIYGFDSVNGAGVVCDAGLNAADADFQARSYGSGPYVIQSIKPQDQIILKRRPEWNWGPNGGTANDPGFPETLTFKVVANETTAANLLVTGDLNLGVIVGADLKRLRSEQGITEQKFPGLIANPMAFNMSSSHLTSNKVVRQAIATAVDPAAYAIAAYDGEALVVRGWYGQNHPCYDAGAASLLPDPPGDLVKAKQILLDDGWIAGPDGKLQKDGKPLAIVAIASNSTGNGPEYVVETLNKIGISATLNLTDDSTHRTNLFGGLFDLAFRSDSAVTSPKADAPIGYVFQAAPINEGGLGWMNLNENASAFATMKDLYAKASADTTCAGWQAWARQFLSELYVMPLVLATQSYFGRGAFYKDLAPPNAIGIRQS
jgi:peptide/nickel transport system substrate-binding protein